MSKPYNAGHADGYDDGYKVGFAAGQKAKSIQLLDACGLGHNEVGCRVCARAAALAEVEKTIDNTHRQQHKKGCSPCDEHCPYRSFIFSIKKELLKKVKG
jgi:hypothetical protein